MTELTKQRIKQLKLHLEERSTSCNVFTTDQFKIDESKISRDRLCFNFPLPLEPGIRVLRDASADSLAGFEFAFSR